MDWLKRIGMIMAGLLLSGVALVILGSFFAIVFVVVVWMIWILWRRLDKEYEYIYTDGHLDIDCVYHFALYELIEAVNEVGSEDAREILETLVQGKRLKDISDLPLDLAV